MQTNDPFSFDEYLDQIAKLPKDVVITAMITDIKNRISAIIGSEQILRLYYEHDERVTITEQDIENLLDIIKSNSQDIVNILSAVSAYPDHSQSK